jgi:hypothetical protein
MRRHRSRRQSAIEFLAEFSHGIGSKQAARRLLEVVVL